MSTKTSKFPLKLISSLVAAITFLADLITVALFIRSILERNIILTSAITQISFIVVVFGFATLLWFYSRQEEPIPDFIFSIFSWIYIVFSAAIFAIISKRFIIESAYTLGEYLGYILIGFFIAGLGYFIYKSNNGDVAFFSIPYLLVALEQIILWIFIIFSGYRLEFDWLTAGNILLFAVVELIVLFFIKNEEPAGQIPLSILISIFLIAGYITLGFTTFSLWYARVLWIVVPSLIIVGVISLEKG